MPDLEERVAALEAAVATLTQPEPEFMERTRAETLRGTKVLNIRLTHEPTGITVVARNRQEAICKLRHALTCAARRQAGLQWKAKIAEAGRAGTETPVKRGSDCPEHGEPLLWLGNGDLICLQGGHFYRLPEPPEATTPSRRRRTRPKAEETPRDETAEKI